MSTTAEAPDLDVIDIDEFVPTTIAGIYDRHVRAGLAADEKLAQEHPTEYADGKRSRINIVVPNDDVEKEVRNFQDSAKVHDRTAKRVGTVPQGDGYTKLSFILTPKQERRRLTDEERAEREKAAAERAARKAEREAKKGKNS